MEIIILGGYDVVSGPREIAYNQAMQLRDLAIVVALGACGGGGAGGAPAPRAPKPVDVAPAPRLDVSLGSARWTIAVRDGKVSTDRDGATVVASAFTLQLSPWPKSEAFVRSMTEHIAALSTRDPNLEVLHELDRGDGDFQAVVRTGGGIDGVVLVPGTGDDCLCAFKLGADADWRAAMDACATLTESMVQGVDAYEQELP